MKSAFVLFAVAGIAASASAQITAIPTPIGEAGGFTGRASPTPVYTGEVGPYSAFAAAAGLAGVDDYTTVAGGPTFRLAQLVFVGGVTTAGGQIRIDFFDSANTPAGNATVTLPSAGDFIWTITFGSMALNGKDSTFAIPSAGTMQLTVLAGTTGRWFFTSSAPTVGSNNIATGTGSTLNPQRYNAFSLKQVPAPASLALMGLGGLIAGRRRR